MKTFKLWVHKSDFSEEEVVISQEDLPQCSVGDVLEIHHPGDEFSRLLLQINSIGHLLKGGTISVQENVAKLFQLRSHRDVNVRKVLRKDVELDLVELVLKDQYIGRSDMYRIKQSLIGSCVFVGKKLSHSGMRVSVRDMFRKDCKVMCGCVSERTRVAYRSASASMLFLVQLSCEMWQFNMNGGLFLETAINGFFADLLSQWKLQQCNHQVSIVLFSRTLYTPQEYDQLSATQQQCLSQAGDGNYYQDFYRVAVDSEIRSDWGSLLGSLRLAFSEHCKVVTKQRNELGCGINSSASRGNLLEAINMAVNVYGRYYMDCDFERNGQQVIVVTPGVGVFEVERDLMSLTKLRIIELGIGADLVCLAEQPLHYVPLFIFRSGPGVNPYKIPHWINHSYYQSKARQRDAPVMRGFQPRIHMPKQFSPIGFQRACLHNGVEINSHAHSAAPSSGGAGSSSLLVTRCERVSNASGILLSAADTPLSSTLTPHLLPFDFNGHTDHEDYDGDIFAYHPRSRSRGRQPNLKRRSRSIDDLAKTMSSEDTRSRASTSHPLVGSPPMAVPTPHRGGHSPPPHGTPPPPRGSLRSPLGGGRQPSMSSSMTRRSSAAPPPTTLSLLASNSIPKSLSFQQAAANSSHASSGAPHHGLSSSSSGKSIMCLQSRVQSLEPLVNPFANQTQPKMTANSARWRQIFPTDDCGKPLQEHHATLKENAPIPENAEVDVVFFAGEGEDGEDDEANRQLLQEQVSHAGHAAVAARNASSAGSGDDLVLLDSRHYVDEEPAPAAARLNTKHNSGLLTSYHSSKKLLQIENSAPDSAQKQDFLKEVGIDWKSLAEPACLPIGTDFEPENLSTDFMESLYTLYYDDEKWDTQVERAAADLAGHPDLSERQIFFQLLLQRLGQGFQLLTKPKGEQLKLKLETGQTMVMRSEYWVVLGQHIHRLRLQSPSIEITRYKPRHQYSVSPVNYRYSLSCQSSCCSTMHSVQFTHPTLDEYNWNYLDQYVCGDRSFSDLLESLKYWRCCFLLLPAVNSSKSSHTHTHTHSHSHTHSQGVFSVSPQPSEESQAQAQQQQQQQQQHPPPLLHSTSRVSIAEPPGDSAFTSSSEVSRPTPKACVRNFVRFVDLLNRIRRPSKTKVRYVVQPKVPDDGSTPTLSPSMSTSSQGPSLSLDTKSSRPEIWSAMQGVHGVDVLENVSELPSSTFMALDGVDWILSHVSGIASRREALAMTQTLLDEHFIQHASGDRTRSFLDGLHFYSFVTAEEREKRSVSSSSPSTLASHGVDVTPWEHFQNSWFEVTLPESALSRRASSFMHFSASPRTSSIATSGEHDTETSEETLLGQGWMKRNQDYYTPASIDHNDGGAESAASSCIKTMVTQSHAHGRSDMPEWCVVRYPDTYQPNCAFHIEVQWMVATGCLVNDMVQGWARKATSCGFHMLPAPLRPFDKASHPLQCGTFVPMDIESILTVEEGELVTTRILLQVQSLLLDMLSFLAVPHLALTSTADPKVTSEEHLQGIPYVHFSGVGFAQPVIGERGDEEMLRRQPSISTLLLSSSEPSDTEVTFDVTHLEEPLPWRFKKVGFLFMPNIMLTGRWRAQTSDTDKTVCEQLQAHCRDAGLLRQLLDQVEITMS